MKTAIAGHELHNQSIWTLTGFYIDYLQWNFGKLTTKFHCLWSKFLVYSFCGIYVELFGQIYFIILIYRIYLKLLPHCVYKL